MQTENQDAKKYGKKLISRAQYISYVFTKKNINFGT